MLLKNMKIVFRICSYFVSFPYIHKYVLYFFQICLIFFNKYVNIFKNNFIFFKYFENVFLNISMERALRATEDRGINVGVPFCPWSQGGAPFFLERTFRARHREEGFGGQYLFTYV